MIKTEKKAIFFDLDNTIYPVSSIGDRLFMDLYKLIEQDGRYVGDFQAIRNAIQRKPFQVVAEEFDFHEDLSAKALNVLSEMEYRDIINPFEDFNLTKNLGCLKFLVTTGFTKLQWSKITGLELQKDFEACFVVDPMLSPLTKKDIFEVIMDDYHLKPEEVLVLGDDIHSEIKAAQELGIDAVVYDYTGEGSQLSGYHVISNYEELRDLIS